jgi:hypothetical protein
LKFRIPPNKRRRFGLFVLGWPLCALLPFAPMPRLSAAGGDNPPPDTIGPIEGEAIAVEGPMSVDVVKGQVKTILRSGSDVRVKAGQAKIELQDGGQLVICGPAHFSILKKGSSLTVALDLGTIHARVGSEVSLTIYTALIQAHPLSIGNGAEDVLVGLDSAGGMCVRAAKGAVRLEQQLTGQSVIVPQNGDVALANGQIETLHTSAGICECELQSTMQPMTAGTEVSQLATKDEIQKRAAEPKAPAAPPPAPADASQQQSQEPVYQVFMPPLHYDANSKPQNDFDPNLIILVRRVRVRPTLIFQGRVEGNPVVAQATTLPSPSSSPKPQPQAATPAKPGDDSTWNRIRTYFHKLWSPTS